MTLQPQVLPSCPLTGLAQGSSLFRVQGSRVIGPQLPHSRFMGSGVGGGGGGGLQPASDTQLSSFRLGYAEAEETTLGLGFIGCSGLRGLDYWEA